MYKVDNQSAPVAAQAVACTTQQGAIPIHVHPMATACSTCAVHSLCLPLGFSSDETARLDTLISQRIRVKKGAGLFHAGEPLQNLYAVRFGSFKTTLVSPDGRGQVTGFLMSGDILGLDAISTERHACSAFALEDSEVCPISFTRLERLAGEFPSLQHNLNRMLSREIVRDHEMLMMMGCHNADERLAAFLVGLSQRFVNRGYSAHGYLLRMSREDIASYLGLRLETVCRSLARLRDLGLIAYQGRVMEILDLSGLQAQVQYGRKAALI
ncbi:Crp/Fnr family transcriptional regulator [Pseudomonas turukhanskensis]|uniref:Crp/Fnr family transcriptional regulator n=2 Tax=Pseudomonas turukhanskensis TaxID=1806536 RepID=A0A9W6NF57_9PSED|nr:Crp/Fnr family transcriptional regulator [Pseudomonas turukhanskensis]